MTAPPPLPEGSKAKIALTGTAATLLLTLAARMEDCHQPEPMLNDKWACYVAEQIDYDYSTIGVAATTRLALCFRSLCFDRWTREFLAEHENQDVTILHIACGLDARAHRVQWGPNVRWIDLDLPDVVEVRRKLLPEPSGDYTLIAGSALDDSVLASIPNDRPTAVLIEGLMYYIEEAQVHELIRSLCTQFPTGELIFDAMSPLVIHLQRWTKWMSNITNGAWMKKQGTGFVSGISDPVAIEKLHPGLKLRSYVPWTEMEVKNPTMDHRLMVLFAQLPLPRFFGYNLRYTF
jgi:O-methyltransferase involved in polyketide biosynthesis